MIDFDHMIRKYNKQIMFLTIIMITVTSVLIIIINPATIKTITNSEEILGPLPTFMIWGGIILFMGFEYFCIFMVINSLFVNKIKKIFDIYLYCKKSVLFINSKTGQVIYFNPFSKEIAKIITFNTREIIDIKLIKDDIVQFRSGIAESVVGGLLFGGGGAIAGSLVGRKIKYNTFIFVSTNNISHAGIVIPVTYKTGLVVCQTLNVLLTSKDNL